MGPLFAFLLLPFTRFALSSPVQSLALDDCAFPSWNVTNLKVTYGAEVSTGGKVSFTFSNLLTKSSEALTCALRANSRCEVVGTPSDKGVHIYLQVSIDTAYWTVNETWSCATNPGTKYVLGVTEMPLACPDYSPTMTCTVDSGTIQAALPTL
jgi:hypothetical protein